VASALVAGGVWWWTRDGWLAAVSWGIGVFIDVDHVIDYVVYERRLPKSARQFIEYFTVRHEYRKVIILFHGFEWMALLWGLAWAVWPAPWGVVVALSYSQHLVLDRITNRHLHPLCYFFFFRWRCHFSRAVLIPWKPDSARSHRGN